MGELQRPFTINFSSRAKHLSATGHWSASEVISVLVASWQYNAHGLFTVHWGRQACQGKLPLSHMGSEAEMLSHRPETFTSKERTESVRTFKGTVIGDSQNPARSLKDTTQPPSHGRSTGTRCRTHSQSLPQFSQR